MQVSDRIGRRMKLHDLHVLMTVVQAGSMNKAAALLHTTQPAISRSIAELEHAFGVRLLDRHQHGVEPTDYGRALLGCGAAVFDELGERPHRCALWLEGVQFVAMGQQQFELEFGIGGVVFGSAGGEGFAITG